MIIVNEDKLREVAEKMDLDTCLRFIKQCEGEDMCLEATQEVVVELVSILVEYTDVYPNGYSDFIKEVKANDFTMKHEKNVKSMGQHLKDALKTIEEKEN